MLKNTKFWIFVFIFIVLVIVFFLNPSFLGGQISYEFISGQKKDIIKNLLPLETPPFPPLDKDAYDKKLIELANNPPAPTPTTKVVKDPKTGQTNTVTIPAKVLPPNIWPVTTVYPKDGAILPFKRIVAYYGNLYSNKMGVLGQYPEEEMLTRLGAEVKKWEVADPNTKVIPALHYITVVAQGSAGADGKYRTRMPFIEIDKVLKIAEKINGIVFLDFQVAFSTLEKELPIYEKYFKMPNVHLGIDPEFSMKGNIRPGKVVGTYDAVDVNFAINFLTQIVKENNLSPKILVVHRYTQKMVTHYNLIKPTPEVQVVMHMDGWGGKTKKIGTYQHFIYKEPVQFTGFKLFYKNDILESGTTMFTPEELMKLNPRPIYIQYQ
ncbi:MAG: hypothetical protein AABX99_00980 [Nanoarchaeota archaeon]